MNDIVEGPPGFPPLFSELHPQERKAALLYISHSDKTERQARIMRVRQAIEDQSQSHMAILTRFTSDLDKGKGHVFSYPDPDHLPQVHLKPRATASLTLSKEIDVQEGYSESECSGGAVTLTPSISTGFQIGLSSKTPSAGDSNGVKGARRRPPSWKRKAQAGKSSAKASPSSEIAMPPLESGAWAGTVSAAVVVRGRTTNRNIIGYHLPKKCLIFLVVLIDHTLTFRPVVLEAAESGCARGSKAADEWNVARNQQFPPVVLEAAESGCARGSKAADEWNVARNQQFPASFAYAYRGSDSSSSDVSLWISIPPSKAYNSGRLEKSVPWKPPQLMLPYPRAPSRVRENWLLQTGCSVVPDDYIRVDLNWSPLLTDFLESFSALRRKVYNHLSLGFSGLENKLSCDMCFFPCWKSMTAAIYLVTKANGCHPHLIVPKEGYHRLIESSIVFMGGPSESHAILLKDMDKSVIDMSYVLPFCYKRGLSKNVGGKIYYIHIHLAMKSLSCIAVLSLLALTLPLAIASDPSPLQDFCVGVNTPASGVFVNGKFCKDPRIVNADDFFSSVLNRPGNVNNAVGSNVTTVNVNNLGGLNTLGISLVRIDYAPNGQNPPHTHPRATEILVVQQGTLLVGFVSSNQDGNRLFAKTLNVGDVFVFPEGLIHFQFNLGRTPAVATAALSSQNAGVITIANTVFGSNPAIDPNVLARAFQMDANVIRDLQNRF
ncbi:hypothetical protein F2Q69_00059879 [Brassica cretica]|uniref:Cupin type-1 domain-containing protein n=1 Tax=Brassica cretica TaxID=69181 RepID=A0A8S9RED6_BRACR|nr:hypothetical protein F2Q69_00059879 [Brassica cretica]